MTDRTPFAATVRSEWAKLRTLRSTRVLLVLSVVLAAGISALLGLVTGLTWDDWDAADRAEYDPIMFSLTGGVVSGLLLGALGAMTMSTEYATGSIRQTLLATPQRERVLLAKCAVLVAVSLVVGLLSTIAVQAAGQLVLASHGLPTVGAGDGELWRTIGWVTLLSPVVPLIALALATLLRSTAGAVVALLGLLFGPLVFGGLLPRSVHDAFGYLPGPVTDRLSTSHLVGGPDPIALGLGLLLVVGWLAVFVGVAAGVLARRDA